MRTDKWNNKFNECGSRSCCSDFVDCRVMLRACPLLPVPVVLPLSAALKLLSWGLPWQRFCFHHTTPTKRGDSKWSEMTLNYRMIVGMIVERYSNQMEWWWFDSKKFIVFLNSKRLLRLTISFVSF